MLKKRSKSNQNNYLISINFQLSALNGRVIDKENKQPISNALVNFIDIDNSTTTDQAGAFRFLGEYPLNTRVKISAKGYETSIIILSDTLLDSILIELSQTHIQLHEVTVSSSTGILQSSTISNVENRKLSELNTIQTKNIGDAMANIPGVYNLSTGNGISKPVIRGLSGMRVLTYWNGLRIENQQWGGDHGLGLNENGIGGVEIIKGPASLLYGADALGGVLYFSDEPYAAQNTLEHSYSIKTHETNTQSTRNFIGLKKLAKQKLRLNVFGGYSNYADFELPNGLFAKNARYKKKLKSSLGYYTRKWSVNIRYNLVQNRIGIPGHTHDTVFTPESFQTSMQKRSETIPAQVISNHYAFMDNTFYLKRSTLKLLTGFTYNNLKEFDEKITVPGIDMILTNYTYNLQWRRNLSKY